jgi:hypothetical protein
LTAQPAQYRLRLSPYLAVSFQRTTRVQESSPRAPTSYGALPIWLTDTKAKHELAADALLPTAPDEAFWIGIEPSDDRIATLLRIGVEIVGQSALIDAVTGADWSAPLSTSPQNYVVSPPQRALLGITSSEHRARQFWGPDASDATGQAPGILRLQLISALPLHIPPLPPPSPPLPLLHGSAEGSEQGQSLGGDPGAGEVPQTVAPDPFGLAHWSLGDMTVATVRLVPHAEFERRSGLSLPEPLDPSKIYGGWRLP